MHWTNAVITYVFHTVISIIYVLISWKLSIGYKTQNYHLYNLLYDAYTKIKKTKTNTIIIVKPPSCYAITEQFSTASHICIICILGGAFFPLHLLFPDCTSSSFHIPPFLFPSTTFSILLSVRYAACALYHQRTARNNHHLNGHHLLQPAVLQLTEISILDCAIDCNMYVRYVVREARDILICVPQNITLEWTMEWGKLVGVLVLAMINKYKTSWSKVRSILLFRYVTCKIFNHYIYLGCTYIGTFCVFLLATIILQILT